MRAADLARALSGVPGVDVTTLSDGLRIAVPAVADAAWLVADQVTACTPGTGPHGGAAVEFTVADGGPPAALIVTGTDFFYAPASPHEVLDSPVPYRIAGAPVLVAHSGMSLAAERIAAEALRPGPADPDARDTGLLLVRCFAAGALRFGMRPVRTAAHWLLALAAAGGTGLPLRPSQGWDRLVREAERVALDPPAPVTPAAFPLRAGADAPTPEDFRRAAPRLTAAGLGPDFAATWRARIPLTPDGFTGLLLDGLGPATAEVDLRPDGGGSVTLRVGDPAAPRALLLLRFPPRSVELWIDEVHLAPEARGSGLFATLLENTRRLASALGARALCLRAAGIGTHAASPATGRHPAPGERPPDAPRPEAREG